MCVSHAVCIDHAPGNITKGRLQALERLTRQIDRMLQGHGQISLVDLPMLTPSQRAKELRRNGMGHGSTFQCREGVIVASLGT